MRAFTASSWAGGITASIAATLLVTAASWVAKLTRRHSISSYAYHRAAVTIALLLVMLANVFLWAPLGEWYPLLQVTSFIIISVITWKEVDQFWQVGLVSADRTVASGLDYSGSLALCTDSLDFLGVGASKLVRETRQFEAAVARCHRVNRPMRFLLCDPEDEELIGIARQAGRQSDEYRRTVQDSLRVLAKLKKGRALNLEVRFYNRLPLFRLMFINERICLASHYVFGEGTGAQLPQLHVVRSIGQGRRDVESLYYPLHAYFQQLWRDAAVWDFESRLD
jgi:hypothetical protein